MDGEGVVGSRSGSSLPVPNVQELAAATVGSGEIPSRYLRPEAESDPVISVRRSELPVIDLSRLLDPMFHQEESAHLVMACEEWGFFQLINHGIPEEVLADMKNDVQEFFKMPLKEKQAYAQLPNSLEGYGQAFVASEEQKLDWADMMYIITRPPGLRDMRFWPTHPPTFRDTLAKYLSAVKEAAVCLLGLMARGVGVDEDVILSKFKEQPQSVVINYYPPCPKASVHEAPPDKISWKDVIHWMWPLFSEDWGSWRSDCLNLSPLPFTDTVTNLPMWHMRLQSPLLLYGFSKEIVECPGYWPSKIHVCGFWFLPMEWQFSCSRCREIRLSHARVYPIQKSQLCVEHTSLHDFIVEASHPCLPIFVGLSSVGSMGFLKNPHAFLLVLRAILEITSYRFILFSAGYEPLDAAVQLMSGTSNSNELQNLMCSRSGTRLFDNRLFCFSGTMPYSWLFPRCAVVIHHGGSGSTAAALHAGTPQIVCPFILDQFYWAERVFWLGVAPEPIQKEHLFPDSEDPRSIKQAADAILMTIKHAMSPEIKDQASQVSERISSEDGVGEALKILRENVVCPSQEEGCSIQNR